MQPSRLLFFVLLAGTSLFAQQAVKQRIANVTGLPSEPIQPSGNCKSSTFGYLEKDHRTSMTDGELGDFVSRSLHDGYIVTIYPATKRGTFVNMQCTNTTAKP
jgi:hypothetical protein